MLTTTPCKIRLEDRKHDHRKDLSFSLMKDYQNMTTTCAYKPHLQDGHKRAQKMSKEERHGFATIKRVTYYTSFLSLQKAKQIPHFFLN